MVRSWSWCANRAALGAVLVLVMVGIAGDPSRAQDQPAAQQGSPVASEAMTGEPAPTAIGGAAIAPPIGPATATATAPHADLVAIVRSAHPVVQAVMALLSAMVFAVAVIALHKGVETTLIAHRLRRQWRQLADGLPDAAPTPRRRDFGARLLVAALAERAAPAPDSLMARLRLVQASEQALALQHWRAGTALLAQVAATAPFIGLFGTVFGIMNSFLAIAASKTSTLAIVAPGIAEALFATAIGLIAAIPAVWVHNWLARRIAANRAMLAQIANRIELTLLRGAA